MPWDCHIGFLRSVMPSVISDGELVAHEFDLDRSSLALKCNLGQRIEKPLILCVAFLFLGIRPQVDLYFNGINGRAIVSEPCHQQIGYDRVDRASPDYS
jgi:hypothetical protein